MAKNTAPTTAEELRQLALLKVAPQKPLTVEEQSYMNIKPKKPIATPIVEMQKQELAPQIGQAQAYNPTADIKSLTELQRQRAIADLGAKRDASLGSLAQQESKIKPMYADKRNQSSTASQLGAKNLAEYMAQRGQTTSGLSAQLEGQRMNSLGNAYAGYNRDEANAFNDINTQRTDISRGYANDLASANMGIQAKELEQIIRARQIADEQSRADAIRQQEVDYQINRDSLADTRYTSEMDYNRQLDTLQNQRLSQQDYMKSIMGLGDQMDYQAEINRVQGDGDPSNDWQINYLKQARQNKIDTQKAEAERQEEIRRTNLLQQQKRALDLMEFNAKATPKVDAKQEYNSNFGLAFNKFKQYPVAEAKRLLSDPTIANEILATLGQDGYKDLWNAVLNDAIALGQALPYGARKPE